MQNVKVTKEIENPLFKRKEIELVLTSDVTPSKNEVDKLLSEKYSAKPDQIRIKKISGKFGSKTFTVTANIYKNREDMFATERFSKKEKEKIKKAEEAAAAPKEEPKPETPVEEKKSEEKPAEDVKEENKVEEKKE